MKPKYRYNHKTGEWNKLYRMATDVAIILPFINPETGLNNTITMPYDHPTTNFWRKFYSESEERK